MLKLVRYEFQPEKSWSKMKKNFLCGIIGPQTDRFFDAKKVRDRGFKHLFHFFFFTRGTKGTTPTTSIGGFYPRTYYMSGKNSLSFPLFYFIIIISDKYSLKSITTLRN